MSICRICKVPLTNDNWYSSNQRSGHTNPICISCQREDAKKYYNPKAAKEERNTPEYKEKFRNYMREYMQEHPFLGLKYRYGLSEEDFKRMLEEQNNTCASCHLSFSLERRPTVDHNHKTEKVRGLLCGQCNRVIGMANDNVDILVDAIEYLKLKVEKPIE
jgi:hypothetical protein